MEGKRGQLSLCRQKHILDRTLKWRRESLVMSPQARAFNYGESFRFSPYLEYSSKVHRAFLYWLYQESSFLTAFGNHTTYYYNLKPSFDINTQLDCEVVNTELRHYTEIVNIFSSSVVPCASRSSKSIVFLYAVALAIRRLRWFVILFMYLWSRDAYPNPHTNNLTNANVFFLAWFLSLCRFRQKVGRICLSYCPRLWRAFFPVANPIPLFSTSADFLVWSQVSALIVDRDVVKKYRTSSARARAKTNLCCELVKKELLSSMTIYWTVSNLCCESVNKEILCSARSSNSIVVLYSVALAIRRLLHLQSWLSLFVMMWNVFSGLIPSLCNSGEG